ncbi:MAG: molybdopterin-guanine dinucleotide biosynthesis protein B [Desulfobulbus sp.]|nr:MAG: molybdopterin-guanine dinucleotide biosynthesis protein B [Desulfobulbus sp.]
MMKDHRPSFVTSQLENAPVIGICGSSGAGKTTLIEALIPRLKNDGLRVAVVKHGAHNVQIDTPGKDSDRFFCAGADVSLFGEECFSRWHGQDDFIPFLLNLCKSYDLVVVEGHASTPVPKIWLLGRGFSAPPKNQGEIIQTFTRQEAGVEQIHSFLQGWLQEKIEKAPVYGCVLIGGKSSRMGQPKHLISSNGQTWLEQAVAKLAEVTPRVVISGQGEVPAALAEIQRIPDVTGLAGPMAGILSVMRWQPCVSWLVMACDLPDVQLQSLAWLLSCRRPGVRAIMPDLAGDGRIDPLLAWYDCRCRVYLEEIAASGGLRMSALANQPGVVHPKPPESLQGSWRNVNTPDELTT